RVFFADTKTAREAGYRPCAVCMPDAYREWKDRLDETGPFGAASEHRVA
ncbi:MAG: Ada metal-binding domain-containing protein, partial [Acidimicrobiales bacterium]